MTKPRFERLLDPFLGLLEAVFGGRRGPIRHTCVHCGKDDFPRVDYHSNQLFCRHCETEIRWWLRDA